MKRNLMGVLYTFDYAKPKTEFGSTGMPIARGPP
ncbi:unnamed protein product [Rhodiola kirilowii]